MSENWVFQLSLKDGSPMINVRSDTIEAFVKNIGELEQNKEPILVAIASFAPQKPEPARPAATPAPAPVVSPKPAGAEVGPVYVKGISKTALKKDGTPMRSPRFTVEFSNGKRLSTFDEMVAGSAETLSGQQVYYSTETKGEFTNLTSVRRAS